MMTNKLANAKGLVSSIMIKIIKITVKYHIAGNFPRVLILAYFTLVNCFSLQKKSSFNVKVMHVVHKISKMKVWKLAVSQKGFMS